MADNRKSLIATGGITSAQEIFKSLILGADLSSSAGFILKNLMQTGPEKVEEVIEQWKQDLNKLFVLTGSKILKNVERLSSFTRLICLILSNKENNKLQIKSFGNGFKNDYNENRIKK